MAVRRELRGGGVGLFARATRGLGRPSLDARSRAQPHHLAMKIAIPVRKNEGEGLRKFRAAVIAGLILCLAACAGPEPLLRSNAKLQLQGREMAKVDVAACQQKAEAAGLKPGTGSRSGNVAAGAGLGLISGAAVGASAGLIGGVAGVTIGAAAGGALGVIIGSVGGAYRPLDPDPPYGDAVVRCLLEKGYDVSGWE